MAASAPTTNSADGSRERRNGGSLTVIGTSIRTVGQLTLESIAWMEKADALVYVVADPIAEDAMKRLNPNGAVSLAGYYGEGMPRLDTYNAMIAHILGLVREGKRTCGAFYGHPGVFAYPSHESIRQARAEGYPAQMLPAVSAEDCLFADLGVDPAVGGLASYEATDFLLNARSIDPSTQLILWQVGTVGDWTYHRGRYDLRAMPLLIERLGETFPLTHEVTVYEAAMFPGCEPQIKRMPLYGLNETEVTAASTLYVPPVRTPMLHPRTAQLYAALAQQ